MARKPNSCRGSTRLALVPCQVFQILATAGRFHYCRSPALLTQRPMSGLREALHPAPQALLIGC